MPKIYDMGPTALLPLRRKAFKRTQEVPNEIMWGKNVTARQATRANKMQRRKDALCMPDN